MIILKRPCLIDPVKYLSSGDNMKEQNSNADGKFLDFNGWRFQILLLLFTTQKVQWEWPNDSVFYSVGMRVHQYSFPIDKFYKRIRFLANFPLGVLPDLWYGGLLNLHHQVLWLLVTTFTTGRLCCSTQPMHVLINERKIESQTLKSIQLTFNSMTKVMSVTFTILNDLVTINLKMFQLTLDTCSFLALTKVLILAN